MSEAADLRWGVCSTIKAPACDILQFAAYHLEQGAHRIYIYLDAPCPDAEPLLEAHPKIRVQLRDAEFWDRKNRKRPEKHQMRQSVNATHAYRRKTEVDWLAHVDVDEFLWTEGAIRDRLAALPNDTICARARPIEALAGGDGTAFKGFIPQGPNRPSIVNRLYPTFGRYLRGGFLSHLQGKLFVRTGLDDMRLRIHNVFQDGTENPGSVEVPEIDLCHIHAQDWDDWLSHYQYRLSRGSYRAELAPVGSRDKGGVTVHEFMMALEAEDGLRAFFDECCADTTALRNRLESEHLLRIRDLKLHDCLKKHFPDFR